MQISAPKALKTIQYIYSIFAKSDQTLVPKAKEAAKKLISINPTAGKLVQRTTDNITMKTVLKDLILLYALTLLGAALTWFFLKKYDKD